ncbi:MAG: 3-hydroxyisobutyrate dehydrogenase [Coriobacteriia bacterium]|nr:MAG: 3-hydroxyisobutyrate dehydrogenase [Coriobacteriia bacterium]
MEQATFDYVAPRVDILSTSQASTQVTKDAALAWKEAVAADNSDAAVEQATEQLLDILEGRPTTIDGVIAFAQGPAKEMFGEEAAAQILAKQEQRKADGAKWCDCDACTAATEILAQFSRVEL